ncbi:hypothetical protein MKZ38_005119 [Zalerion maritima]|uniref:Uncharacterized protein n=1 Tax=Zalerion maritima TaxID=339359 RepID=A0AAD5RKT3_9PEZI|nr:hypothetical protein MKZ38_005119 [Zalerion maritima]
MILSARGLAVHLTAPHILTLLALLFAARVSSYDGTATFDDILTAHPSPSVCPSPDVGASWVADELYIACCEYWWGNGVSMTLTTAAGPGATPMYACCRDGYTCTGAAPFMSDWSMDSNGDLQFLELTDPPTPSSTSTDNTAAGTAAGNDLEAGASDASSGTTDNTAPAGTTESDAGSDGDAKTDTESPEETGTTDGDGGLSGGVIGAISAAAALGSMLIAGIALVYHRRQTRAEEVADKLHKATSQGALDFLLVDATVRSLVFAVKIVKELGDVPDELARLAEDLKFFENLAATIRNPSSHASSHSTAEQDSLRRLAATVNAASSLSTDISTRMQELSLRAGVGSRRERLWKRLGSVIKRDEILESVERLDRLKGDTLGTMLTVRKHQLTHAYFVLSSDTTKKAEATILHHAKSAHAIQLAAATSMSGTVDSMQQSLVQAVDHGQQAGTELSMVRGTVDEILREMQKLSLASRGGVGISMQIAGQISDTSTCSSKPNYGFGDTRQNRFGISELRRRSRACWGCSCFASTSSWLCRKGAFALRTEKKRPHERGCPAEMMGPQESTWALMLRLRPFLNREVQLTCRAEWESWIPSFTYTAKTIRVVSRNESPAFRLFDEFIGVTIQTMCADGLFSYLVRFHTEDRLGSVDKELTCIQELAVSSLAVSRGGSRLFDLLSEAAALLMGNSEAAFPTPTIQPKRFLYSYATHEFARHLIASDIGPPVDNGTMIFPIICYLQNLHGLAFTASPWAHFLKTQAETANLSLLNAWNPSPRLGDQAKQIRVLQEMVRGGADNFGLSDLHMAVLSRSLPDVKRLVAKSSTPPYDPIRFAYSVDACALGWPEGIRFMAESGMNVFQAAIVAPFYRDVETTKALLDSDIPLGCVIEGNRGRINRSAPMGIGEYPHWESLFLLSLAMPCEDFCPDDSLDFEEPSIVQFQVQMRQLIVQELLNRRQDLLRLALIHLPSSLMQEIHPNCSTALDAGAPKAFEELIARGIPVPTRLDPGTETIYTWFLIRCPSGGFDLACALWESGFVDIDAPSSYGCTPLRWMCEKVVGGTAAEERAQFELIEWLISRGADPTFGGPSSSCPMPTVLFWAAFSFENTRDLSYGQLFWDWDADIPLHLNGNDLFKNLPPLSASVPTIYLQEAKSCREQWTTVAKAALVRCNPLRTDNCDCYCSTRGCLTLHKIPLVKLAPDRTGSGEWLAKSWADIKATTKTWIEALGLDASQKSFYTEAATRLEVFQRLRMTHTCYRQNWNTINSFKGDIAGIQEEEGDLSAQLDVVMQAYETFSSRCRGNHYEVWDQWWVMAALVLPPLEPFDRARLYIPPDLMLLYNYGFSRSLYQCQIFADADEDLARRDTEFFVGTEYEGLDFMEIIERHFAEYLRRDEGSESEWKTTDDEDDGSGNEWEDAEMKALTRK